MFGLKAGVNPHDHLYEKLLDIWDFFDKNPKLRKLSKYQRHLVLHERYLNIELGYEVPEGASSTALLSMIAGEDYRTNARWKRRLLEYRVNRVCEDYGLSFTEFHNYPTFMVEDILKEQRARLAEERRISDAARKEAARDTTAPQLNHFGSMPFRSP